MNKLAEEIGILEEMIENANIENMDMNDCFGGEHIEAIEHILSDYKRVLKELEEKTTILLAGAEKVKQLEKENKKLKEDRNNNNEMVALARNEVLNYMTGYEDGKKHKMTATAQVVENQQYYIIQKQMEKYEEHIKRLQKENEELKAEMKDGVIGIKLYALQTENEKLKKKIDLMENYMVENGWEICFDNIYAELNNCNGMERDWCRGDKLEKQDIHKYFSKKLMESEE